MDAQNRQRRATYVGRNHYKQRRLNQNRGPLDRMCFILAGQPPPPLNRLILCPRIIENGGDISSKPTPQITHALVGENPSDRKLELIERLGIQRMTYEELLELLG